MKRIGEGAAVAIISVLKIFILLYGISFVSPSKSSFQRFIDDCYTEDLKYVKEACDSSRTSYFHWLIKHRSTDSAIACLFSQLKSGKLSTEQKNHHLILLHALLKRKSCVKQAIKLVTMKEKAVFFTKWDFLGPFQIGKQEVDGHPSFNDKYLDNRWNKKFVSYTELSNTGKVKWKEVSAVGDSIQLMPKVDWNDLVMSMQSMAMTEWQGILVNDFIVASQNMNIMVQCLGVSHFYVDGNIFNGDVYHRDFFWNPLKLSIGVHTLIVPVRLKGPGVIKCLLKTSINKNVVFNLNKSFKPDFVDGNLFSSVLSVPISNNNNEKHHSVESVLIESHSFPGFNEVQVKLCSTLTVLPGQISSLNININNKILQSPQSSCPKKPIILKLKVVFTEASPQDISIEFRCRKSSQSFLFTFLDHDGSIQHAAAIKPLKPCLTDKCPVLLSLHGTGVSAESQADSYKQMVKKDFVFGVEKMWVLAPTRHGAHNWEGPGELTSLSALKNLALLTKTSAPWLEEKAADANVVIFAGHSMGGHGAWQLSTHHPDKAIAVISAAGWLSKEEYGDSNLFYRHDISISHTDPAVKMIQESCIVENQNDKHASNLKGLPVFMRIGAADKTVHPYYSRRMFRLSKENNVDVTYKELPGKEHWWWDTVKENDGGVTNDGEVRKFIKSVIDHHEKSSSYCSANGCSNDKKKPNKYQKKWSRTSGTFNFVVYNPASFSGGRGILVMQQDKPLRKSTYDVTISQNQVTIKTNNIRRIRVYEPTNEPIDWLDKETISFDCTVLPKTNEPLPWELCKIKNIWNRCNETNERDYRTYGPARRIAEKPFAIVICEENDKSKDDQSQIRNAAIFLSNLFHLTSDAFAPIKRSSDLIDDAELKDSNVILLGEEKCIEKLNIKREIRLTEDTFSIGNCNFSSANPSAVYLAPKDDGDNLFLVMTSYNVTSIIQDVLKLAIPTIPPMTRSPFSNLLPDYAVFTSDINRKGPGGYLCSGFWDNNWKFDITLSSCFC